MASSDVDLHAAIERLERRLDRERRARREAEEIAEAGLRSLYDANQELDRRILERTAELNRALEIAEAANNAKSSFLGQMSHQINTPLNGLLGMLELLAGELPDTQSIEWHASAMRSARRLERLTTRLITYVELEDADFGDSGQRRKLSEVLSRVHDRWHGPCLRSGQLLAVELQPGTDSSVYAHDELDLLFDELLSNVVEHAGPGAVLIGGRMADSSTVVVEISDPGIGVDPVLAERAHELNASPNQTQRGDDKVNLGLALVDRIVEALGGEWGPVDDGRSAIAIRFPIAAS